ncbi:MAG: cell shape-determining protein, partial [Sphingomonadaceae bacterium]|nr:cell shape-determining protein [Sphingomonadaceae bacterium]
MYRPRQPERTEPSRTAPADRESVPAPGSLLSARRLQPERRKPDAPEASVPEARPQATPGSLLAAGPAAQARAPEPTPPSPPAQQASASPFLPGLPAIGTLGIDDFIAWLRDGLKWIVLAVVLCMAAAFAYSLVVTSRYSVYTDIVIDPANLNVVTDDVFTTSPQRDAQLMEVESRLRVLTSRNVYARVIDRLNLTEDDEFVQPGAIERIKALVGLGGAAEEPGEGGKRVAAMRALSERVQAHREDRSFVVVLRVWSEDPLKAVAISDAIVNAFEEELFSSAAESAGRVA